MATPIRTCGPCIRRQYFTHYTNPRLFSTRTSPLRNTNANPLRTGNARPSKTQDITNTRRSMTRSAAGIAACAVAMYGMIELDVFGLKQAEQNKADGTAPETTPGAMKMDGPPGFPNDASGHSVIQDGADFVETGTSTIPHFPSTIRLPKTLDENLNPGDDIPSSVEEDEYQLLGLGIRTVSFLSIQVYVVGMYVATADISELQQRLVRTALNPPGDNTSAVTGGAGANYATSLVPGERQQLKNLLLDPEIGDDVWDAILKKDGLRTAFRIVPTRNTDFLHLRDGWVRGITARAQKANTRANADASTSAQGEYEDDTFGSSLNSFKGLFGGGQRKSVPKGQILVLTRSSRGELDALFRPGPGKPVSWLGRVDDERISRLVWLNYLAGKNVSSDAARRSVVDGVMGIVERPVGTVIQKIV
ncbi:chalcone isomerase domain-containing protein [Aspergillus ruber CBS 135680]|uniref:Chalcone isomerase n=1 Tax=Aspergillus ruber (strain CBS 135680) TaxID=1388766 RepID=A0A017SSV0_ASPRC|nr:chalcone isomerase [Aspergillus ruber CBS 135680]EYE99370.1 chalcone isomerase [Aspergillus ruber CBS 135680]